jgi:RimJ/RimL family protein N-acetyltransferase
MGDSDEQILWELDQDPAVMQYINGGTPTSRKTTQEVYLPRLKSYTSPTEGWGMWSVSLIDSQEFLGWVLVRPMEFFSDSPEYHNLELGWRFKQKAWGKGYATEAAEAIKQSFIDKLDCDSEHTVKTLSAVAFPDNVGSINIMQKLGMRYLKTDVHQDPLGDETVVYYEYQIE